MSGGRRRDVVVIGAGLAGCEIAAAVGDQGLDTLVVEAGPVRSAGHIAADPATASLEQRGSDPDFRHFLDAPSGSVFASAGYRRRVGGRSLYWRGIVLPLEERALAGWPTEVRDVLLGSPRQPGSYTATQQALQEWVSQYPDGVGGNPREEALLAQLCEIGLPARATPRAVRHLPGGRWAAYSALPRIPSGQIIADAPAAAVEPLDDGGFEIRLAGSDRPIAADRVVLAAGALGNIALADRLIARSRGGAAPAYAVVDHVATGCVFLETGQATVPGPDEASAYLGFRAAAGSNLFVEAIAHADGVLHDTWAMGEQPPAAPLVFRMRSGELRLDEVGHGVARAIDAVRAGQEEAIREVMDLRGIPLRDDADLRYDEAERRALADPGTAYVYRELLGDLDHESGGLPIGGDVVDSVGGLIGYPGLYVAGTALFPRAGAANPSLTTLCLARYQAAHLIGELATTHRTKAEDRG